MLIPYVKELIYVANFKTFSLTVLLLLCDDYIFVLLAYSACLLCYNLFLYQLCLYLNNFYKIDPGAFDIKKIHIL